MTLTSSFWPASSTSPVLETTVGSVLRATAEAHPDSLALVDWGAAASERRTWTYARLLQDAGRVAQALLQRFRPGERVAIYAPNSADWVLLELGCGLAGVVLVTVNPAYRATELEYVLRQSRAAGLFHADAFRGNPLGQWAAEVRSRLPELREGIPLASWPALVDAAPRDTALPHVRPLDAAQIQYTSGTTGSPKGALLHHRGLTNNARLFAEIIELRPGDVLAHAMPLFHTVGCVMATLGSLHAGAANAFLPAFDAGRLLDMLEAERATHTVGVPTMLLGLMDHPELPRRGLDALRVAVCGGASVPPELVRAMEQRLGVRFSIVYGQTECSPLITMARLTDTPEDKAGTIGPPLPQTDVKIVDPVNGDIRPVGEVGELCTRGYHVMHGYFDKPEATAAAIDAEGWLHTGDLATMDARGYCRITGRLKDMVIRGGENMFPAEIEAVLYEHPGVADVAIVGVTDRVMGEELAAFVRTRAPRPTALDLHAHVRTRLAAPKAPRYWVFVDDFPLTGSGKVQKFMLRQRWDAGGLDVVDIAVLRGKGQG